MSHARKFAPEASKRVQGQRSGPLEGYVREANKERATKLDRANVECGNRMGPPYFHSEITHPLPSHRNRPTRSNGMTR